MTRRILAVTFVVLVLIGCSSKTKESSSPQVVSNTPVPTPAEQPKAEPPPIASEQIPPASASPPGSQDLDDLAASNWVFLNWSAKDLDRPLDARDADIVRVDEGLQVTAYGRIGKYRATFRRELLDNFELTATIIQPSEQELRQAGLQYPSPFYIKVGFRGASGFQSPEVSLHVDRNVRATSEIRLRASGNNLSFAVGRVQPTIFRRPKIEPGYFFIELHQDRRIVISNFVVRQDLPPDVELAAALPQSVADPQAFNSGAQPPAGMMGQFPAGMMRPPAGGMPPMGFPNGNAMAPPGLPIALFPPPSRGEPLLSCNGWYVSKLGDSGPDQTIKDDLKLSALDNRMRVEKSSQSADFWILRKIGSNADIDFNCRIVVPSFREMSATLDPTSVLGVGVFLLNDAQQSLTLQAPPPLPDSPRDFDFTVRRSGGRVTMNIAGADAGNSLSTNEDLLVGLYVRGGIRFTAEAQDRTSAIANRTQDGSRTGPLANSSSPSQTPQELESKPTKDQQQVPSSEPVGKRSAADMIATSEKSVVRIETVSDGGNGIGSGFVVDSKGTVITNCHVLAGATSAKAFFSDGQAYDIVGTLVVDEGRDIVVAKLSVSDRDAIELASELPRKGEAVVGLGAPHGLAFTATKGIVSAIRPAAEMAKELGKESLRGTWVQVDAALSPGNSGGPLVNELGQVVAMSTLASQGSAQNLNFGISAIDVRDALNLSQGRPAIVLRESVANIRSKSDKQRNGAGSRGSSSGIPDSAIRKYLTDCRESFATLTRDLRKEIERLQSTLKEMEKGETSIPSAISKVPGIEIMQYVTPQRKTVWFFRSEAVKARQIERTTARMKTLMKARTQVKSPNDPESILQLALNFGPKLDARQNQSVGFVSDGTVLSAFNAHDVLVMIEENGYLMWLESTAGLDLGEKILASPVFVNGTATVEIPDKGSRSVTVLRQVLEQEIRDFAEQNASPPMNSNSPPISPKPSVDFRTWSDKSGKFSIEAQLVSSDGDKVKLKRRDGKIVDVPKAMLSEGDQEYLSSQ